MGETPIGRWPVHALTGPSCAAQDPIHPPGTIESALSPDKHLGEVDMSTVAAPVAAADVPRAPLGPITQLGECLNLEDIEVRTQGLLDDLGPHVHG